MGANIANDRSALASSLVACCDYSEGGSCEADQLSIDMARAKAAVETTLRPYLDAPTFGEFLFPPELVRAIRRVGSVTATLK
jgi:hypothetical protein